MDKGYILVLGIYMYIPAVRLTNEVAIPSCHLAFMRHESAYVL
jgi:hypothetical protein